MDDLGSFLAVAVCLFACFCLLVLAACYCSLLLAIVSCTTKCGMLLNSIKLLALSLALACFFLLLLANSAPLLAVASYWLLFLALAFLWVFTREGFLGAPEKTATGRPFTESEQLSLNPPSFP